MSRYDILCRCRSKYDTMEDVVPNTISDVDIGSNTISYVDVGPTST
jgi:hypothetical protein